MQYRTKNTKKKTDEKTEPSFIIAIIFNETLIS